MRSSIGMLALIGFSSCAVLPVAQVPTASAVQSKAVVFDIDGTLTPDVMDIFGVRPDAAQVVQAFAANGYKIVYLSARVKAFQGNLPGWLKNNGFPDGAIHVQRPKRMKKITPSSRRGSYANIRHEAGHSNTPTEIRRSILLPTPMSRFRRNACSHCSAPARHHANQALGRNASKGGLGTSNQFSDRWPARLSNLLP